MNTGKVNESVCVHLYRLVGLDPTCMLMKAPEKFFKYLPPV